MIIMYYFIVTSLHLFINISKMLYKKNDIIYLFSTLVQKKKKNYNDYNLQKEFQSCAKI